MFGDGSPGALCREDPPRTWEGPSTLTSFHTCRCFNIYIAFGRGFSPSPGDTRQLLMADVLQLCRRLMDPSRGFQNADEN